MALKHLFKFFEEHFLTIFNVVNFWITTMKIAKNVFHGPEEPTKVTVLAEQVVLTTVRSVAHGLLTRLTLHYVMDYRSCRQRQ